MYVVNNMAERKRNDEHKDNGNDPSGNRTIKDSKYDDPPNSRLFIVCGKTITEKEFDEAFSRFGTIEEIWVVKDRTSGEPKGVAYIKFSKTSEAAAAMEEMNGSCIASHPRPLKVLIAHSREQGSKREMNEEERLLRLFVVVPKTMTEVDIRQHFNQFGDIDYVSIVKDHSTRESKGFAYVKYHRVTHAAKAYEGCDRNFKPVFAEPKPPKPSMQDSVERYLPSQNNFGGSSSVSANNIEHYNSYSDISSGNPENYTRLSIIASPSLNQDQLWRLFDLVPSMDYCQLIHDPKTRQFKGHAFVVYKNPQAAAYAREKLHGFEYPIGQRLIVKPDIGAHHDLSMNVQVRSAGPALVAQNPGVGLVSNGGMPRLQGAATHLPPSGPPMPPPPPSLQTDLATLAETIAHATSLIQAAGLSQMNQQLPPGAILNRPDETYDPRYCSVALPPRQHRAPYETEVAERLFVVCQPEPPPAYALKDAFSRFGNLIDVFMIGTKNCGYAKYASKESAAIAMATLHGQSLCGMRLKVLPAEPAKPDSSRKRIRVDDQ